MILSYYGWTGYGIDFPEHDESTPAETKISSYRSYGIVITDELQSYKELEPEILRQKPLILEYQNNPQNPCEFCVA
jgi:hypothetical protein